MANIMARSVTSLATRAFVDGLFQARDWKRSVRVITATALPSYGFASNVITASAVGALPAVDGVSLNAGDRMALKDGASGADNGIYEVTSTGSGSSPFVLTRAADANTSALLTRFLAFEVEEGTQAGAWICTNTGTITLNTTAITLSNVAAAATIAAGTGLSKSGNTISLANTAVTPGSYTSANLTVDAQGRITAASNGSGGVVTPISRANGGFGADVSTGLTADHVAYVDGTGGITIGALPATAVPSLDASKIGSGTLAVARGGTGLGSYTQGDLLYASGASTLARLAAVATGQVLVSAGTGTAPAYSATPTVTTLTAATSLLAPLFDRASAGTLALGGTATTVQLAAGVSLSGAAGAGALSLGSMTGNTTLPTGNISWTGTNTATLNLVNTATSNIINWTIGNLSSANSSNFHIRGQNIRLQTNTGTDALWILNGSPVFYGSVSSGGGTQNWDLSASTGAFTFPTGAVTYSGASGSAVSLTATGSTGTMLLRTTGSGAHLTVQTSGTSAYVVLDGTTGVVLRRNGSYFCDFGNSSSTLVTLAAGISLSFAAGGGGLSLGSGTGAWTMPTGNGAWTGATNATLTLTASGASGNVTVTGAATCRFDGGTVNVGTTTATIVNVGRSGQSIGLYGATAVGRHSSTGQTAGFTAGAGTGVVDGSTFTGGVGATAYTIGDVVKALKNIGLMAA